MRLNPGVFTEPRLWFSMCGLVDNRAAQYHRAVVFVGHQCQTFHSNLSKYVVVVIGKAHVLAAGEPDLAIL